MKAETRKILDDLKTGGFDISSIERQMQVDPTLDKVGDNVIGGGLLRQNQYTYLANQAQQMQREAEAKIKNLATAHDSLSILPDGELKTQTLEYIKQMEDALIATGEYTEESIKNLSFAAGKGLKDLTDGSGTDRTNQNNNSNGGNQTVNNNQDFIDAKTLRDSMGNVAMGGILTNMKVNQAIEEARSLGVVIDTAALSKLEPILASEMMREGGSVQSAVDKAFDLQTVRANKQKEAQDKLVNDAYQRGLAERNKGDIPSRNSQRLALHPIIDRSNRLSSAIATAEGANKKSFVTAEGNIDPASLPKNEKGEVNRFMLRGSRADRVASASKLYSAVEDHYSNDPTYVE